MMFFFTVITPKFHEATNKFKEALYVIYTEWLHCISGKNINSKANSAKKVNNIE